MDRGAVNSIRTNGEALLSSPSLVSLQSNSFVPWHVRMLSQSPLYRMIITCQVSSNLSSPNFGDEYYNECVTRFSQGPKDRDSAPRPENGTSFSPLLNIHFITLFS